MTALKSLVTQNGTTQQIGNGDSLLVGTGIDRSTAGDLTIGGTTATSVTLGSATIPVNIPGDVTTVGGTTFTTDATFEGNVTFGAGPADTVTFAALTTVNSNIAFAGGSPTYKITNLANGTNPNDAVNYSQLSALVTGVSSFQTSLSGLTPSSATGGAITLAGTLGVASGGTGQTTLSSGALVVGNGGSAVNTLSPGSNGQVLTVVGGAWAAATPATTSAQGGANAVQYANATTPADFDGNANFVYTEATGRLGIGTASPSTTLHVNSGAVNGTAIATLQNTAGDFQVFRVDANPEGSVTGSIGDIADDSTNGVVYVKTSGSATNTGWSPLANLGTKVYLVVEGGQYATIQAAIDATPTGTNTVPAYSVILVGPKANTGGGGSGSWGPAVLAANKSLMIAGLGGAQTAKDIRIDSLTFDSSAAGLNANLNENYISGLYITSSSVTSVVTYSGTGAIRLRLNNCYVVNTGAGDAVTNTNSNVSGSLYLDQCIVSAQSVTGLAVKNSGYTQIRNRCDISTAGAGASSDTGRAISSSAGVIEIFDSTITATAPRPAVELTGTAYLAASYTAFTNANNTATATVVTVAASATFATGFTSLALGSSVAALGSNVAGAGTFVYGNVSFGYVPTLTVTTQTPGFSTAPWFTTKVKQGVSLTAPGSGLLEINASGRLNRYNDAAPTNGQVLIGDTAAGYWKAGTITAGSGVSITNGAGSITIAATGSGGTVTSVDVSGGTTGLTTSGGPITGSGTITLAGTLNVANGGTGASTFTAGAVLFGNGASAIATDSANLFFNDSTNQLGVGTASVNETLTVNGRVSLAEGTVPSNTAGYGKLWADSTDKALHFYDNSVDYLVTPNTVQTLTYAASVALDFAPSLPPLKSVTLTGDITFTTSNLGASRNISVRIVGDSSARALTFPAGWKWLGGTTPASLAANKTAILSLAAFSGADSGVVASWSYDGVATLTVPQGGTGITSYAVGDLLYADTTTSLAKLADVATGNALISGGVGVAPSWGKIGLATHVTGTLPIANGGTGQTTASAAFGALSPLTTKGDLLGYDTANARVPVGTDGQVLTADSTQAAGVKWSTPTTGTVTSVTASAPLASSGGATPDISLTGTVGVANGGTGTSTAFTQGSVVFAGASGVYAQDNSNLFWDDTANALYLGPRGSVVTSVGYPFNTVAEGASNAALAAWTFGNASPSSAAKMAMERARGTAASPSALAAGDVIGEIIFNGYTDQRVGAAQILGYAATGWGASGSDAPGNLWFLTSSDGSATPTQRFAINAGIEAVVNDPGNNFDFRVESQANANMLLVDASQNSVSVGTSGNTHTFNVGSGSSANFCVGSGGRIHTYDGSAPTNGQVLIGDTASGNFAKAAITAGTGISVTNGAGSITIAATGAAAATAVQLPFDTSTNSVGVGEAAYASANSVVNKAVATAASTSRVLGIVSSAGVVCVAGIASSASFITGLSLGVGQSVYLSKTAGKLTNDVSAFSTGDVVAELGIIVSYTSGDVADVLLQPKSITVL